MDPDLILAAQGVRYRYPGTVTDALVGVPPTARRGVRVAVLGPNGWGETTLSGGEYQRVRLARALAQEPALLVLDEPTISLDLRHEMELFELVRGLVDRSRLAAVLVTHHVNLAARFADRVLLLDAGRPAGEGDPEAVLTRANVERVFAWPVAIEPFQGAPQVIPIRRRPDV